MAYRVELSRRAQQDIEDLREWVSTDDSTAAVAWFERLKEAFGSLEHFPRRCPVAAESRSYETEMRHLLYGEKHNRYRVIYQIDDSRRVVSIVTIRHSAMDEFTPLR